MKEFFNELLEFFYSHPIILISFYLLVILVLIIGSFKIKQNFKGAFGEANVFKRLKRIYNQSDYPYIKEIILPINKESYAYYDAIVFGDRYIYILEIKNHPGSLKIDPLDDWLYLDKNNNPQTIINPFYELELKKHVLNRFLEVDRNRIIEIVVYNTNTKCIGNKGNHHLIAVNQVSALIKHYEAREISKFSPDLVEKKGNYILGINVKNKKIRKKVINDLKDQRSKR